jgi:hypothetical protein
MVGEPLTYSGTISNAGNITLSEVVVHNSMTGAQDPVLGLAALAPGEVWSFTGIFIVPEDFCEPDTVTVNALSICDGVAVADSATSTCPVVTTPGIIIVSVGPAQPVVAGQPATFTGIVLNTGNVTLNNIMVVNSMPVANSPVMGPVTLAPGQTTNFTYTYTPPWGCNCCELVNTFAVNGRDRCASRQVSATYTVVSKYLTHPRVIVALECPTGAPGQSVEVPGTVMNSSDITLTNVIVTGNDGARLVGPITLARGETQDFATTYTMGGLLRVAATAVDACTGLTVIDEDVCGQVLVQPVIGKPSINGETITLTWTSQAGVTYRVQSCASLISPVWVNEPGDVVASGATCSKSLGINTGTATRYYRVIGFSP